MCEFNVIVDDKVVFREVIYVKKEGDRVVVEDVLGESRVFEGYEIVEVDVKSVRLVLNQLRSS